ncbi:uncharacterized protein BXZ73DRAFT_103986 [Epithele typhae]|uniref:uncharacterized protein n=1 Tax=Epithele typhae TaxID=378194 RepID=UPI002008C2FD|nr:uncharacterized protein BXZ73DRAFT_103986 [Epithele typhae]KAH9923194.1 hypothetical protein BXZ73DRAFT_103986 [Epithele typhae]
MSANSTAADPAAAAAAVLAALSSIRLDNTLGAQLVGVLFSVLLNGMLISQTFQYYRAFPKDKPLLKAWVAIVVVLETFTTALICHTAYFYLITKYWDPTYFFIGPPVWSINLLPPPATVAALLSQSFFARRVWFIAPKFRPIVVIAIILIAGNVGCYSAMSVMMFRASTISAWLQFSWLATVGSSIQMGGDLMITSTLIYVLNTSRTGVNNTNTMLDTLITYAISSGLTTCVVHILNVAFSIKYPDNFIYAALSLVLTKLYATSFLVALNTRKSLGIMSAGTSEPSPYHGFSGASVRMNHPPPSNVHVSTGGYTKPYSQNMSGGPIELKVVTEVVNDVSDEYGRRRGKATQYSV